MNNENLTYWQKILEDLGFESKYYDYLDGVLYGVDWFNGEEYIRTELYYSEEYEKQLRSLPDGTEYTPDWDQCIVHAIEIKTPEFAYPEGSWDEDGWNGNIRLSDISYHDNYRSLSLENFKKALWMSRNSITAKNKIVRGFIAEVDTFLNRYGNILKELGFEEEGDELLLVGYELSATEPSIEYSHKNAYNLGKLFFSYNMFTEKLYMTKVVNNPNDKRRLKPYFHYQLNVNDMSEEEFKSEVIEHLKQCNLIK